MAAVSSVAVVNKGALPDSRVALIVEAYRQALPAFCAAWDVPVPGLVVYPSTHTQAIEEEAALFFVDSANQPDAFGFHTELGVAVFGYVDMSLCTYYEEPHARVFGHELFEMVADPGCDRWIDPYSDGTSIAIEVCDPVQRFSENLPITDPVLGSDAVEIADYVLPTWFDPTSSGPWSAQGNAPESLLDADGGYHLVMRNGVVVSGGSMRAKSFGRSQIRLSRRGAAKR